MNDQISPTPPLETDPGYLQAERAAWWALVKNAEDLVILDLRGRSDVCDFFLIATGAVEVQVRAICESVGEGMARDGQRAHHEEGLVTCRWALLDFVDLVVHVFQPAARAYYQLERLWGDAPRVALGADHFRDPTVQARHPWLPAFAAGAGTPPPSPGTGES